MLDAISTDTHVNWTRCWGTRLRLAVLSLALGGAACATAEEPKPEAPLFRPPKSALVSGVVMTSGGLPVPATQITAAVHLRRYQSGECMAPDGRMAGPVQTWADSAGAFEIEFHTGRTPTIAGCLWLEALPPEGSESEPRILDNIPLNVAAEGQPGREISIEIILERK